MSVIGWVLIVVWGIIPTVLVVIDSIVSRTVTIGSAVFYLLWVALPLTVFGAIIGFHVATWMSL